MRTSKLVTSRSGLQVQLPQESVQSTLPKLRRKVHHRTIDDELLDIEEVRREPSNLSTIASLKKRGLENDTSKESFLWGSGSYASSLEIYHFLKNEGGTVEQLVEARDNEEEDFPWSLPSFQEVKEKFTVDLIINETKIKGLKWHIPCSRCKMDELYPYEEQTRSLDEGGTHFLICLNCGARMRA